MRSTERFSDRVDDYARYRPRYPPQVLDVLRQETGFTAEWSVTDIGSGSGLSAELFLANGNHVIGVEPNPAMREAAERQLSRWPAFRSIAGTAEDTTLATGSVDIVVAAQAFHWFDAPAARLEFDRILRPGGWVTLLWNTRRTGASPFMTEYEALLERHGTDYARVRHERIDASRLAAFFGGRYVRRTVDNEQTLDLDGLTGRVLSSSYTPREGTPGRQAMLEDVQRLFAAHQEAGQVVLLYETEVYTGRLNPGPEA